MAEEKKTEGKGDFKDYQSLKVHIDIWWSAKDSGHNSSLSLYFDRTYVEFNFKEVTGGQECVQVRRLRKDQVFVMKEMLESVMKTRRSCATLAALQGTLVYPKINDGDLSFETGYFSKEASGMVMTGGVRIHTVTIDDIERVAISTKGKDNKDITVVLGNHLMSKHLEKISEYSVIDLYDVPFYRLCLELDNALKCTLMYNAIDKIWQRMTSQGKVEGGSGGKFLGFFGNKSKQSQTPKNAEIHTSTGEEGENIFDDAEF